MALIPPVVDYVRGLVSPLLNGVVVAVFTFFIGLIVGRIAGKIAWRALHAFEADKLMKAATQARFSLERVSELAVSYLVYFIFLIIALNQLGLTQWVLIVISGSAGILAIIAAVLALKDVIPNAVAGLVIMRRQFPKKGDRIRIETVEGRVQELTLLELRIKTRKGDLISFPNRKLLKSTIQGVGKSLPGHSFGEKDI